MAAPASKFDSGVGVDAHTLGWAGAGLDRTRTTRGYLFAFLKADTGVGMVRGPEGQQETSANVIFSWITIATRTDGRWIYAIPAGGGYIGGPVLWVIELPS